jgi:hypothetical protein
MIGFYNRDEKCLQRGTDWVFKQISLHFNTAYLPLKQWTTVCPRRGLQLRREIVGVSAIPIIV